jgi:hypothetical protein
VQVSDSTSQAMQGALCVTVILVAMVFGTSAARASLTFFNGPTYPYGGASDTSPVALAALGPGGAMDLVAVDRLVPGSIMVRLGNSDGTFRSPVDYPVTGTITALLVADVNKDGKPDVIVVDHEGFSVLLGNGDGTLKPAIRYTPLSNNETRIAGFALGDFNGDGNPDVVFGGCTSGGPLSSGRLNVWLNQGNGTFAPGSTSANGACPEEIVAGRFHGSGHPDDAAALENGDLAIHAANGDGTLQSGVSIGGPLAPPSQSYEPLATGDFNGDGNLDVVWAANTLGIQGLLIFPGNGSGSFAQPIETRLEPERAGSFAVADFNYDGIDDLAVAPLGAFWSGAQVLLGTPSGHFILGSSEPLQATPLPGTQIAAGDINGDGYPDLVVADHGTITPYLNGSLVSFGTEFVELGTISQNASSTDKTVTISNAGDPPLHISSVEIVPVPEAPGNAPQDFAIDENGCSGQTLPAGTGQCRITVRFTPTGAGERDAALQVNSNSPESPSFQFLTGVGVAPPTNTTPPAISGSPAVGQTLSCTPGAWSGVAPKFAYQWLHDGSPIAGSTGSTYTLTAADAGHTLDCQVTATNSAGSATVKSAPIGVPSLVATAGMTHVTVKGATVSTLLTCSGHPGANCNITLTLTVTETLKGRKLIAVGAATKRTKAVKRTVTLATRTLTIPAGQSETVHIKLDATGLRLLTRRHSLRVKLIATQTLGTTSTIVSSQTVSLKHVQARSR